MVSLNKHRFYFSISFVRISYKRSDSKHDIDRKNPLKNESCEGLNWYFPKDAHQKSERGQWGPIKKTRLLHLRNVEKSAHPQFSAQRACEGKIIHFLKIDVLIFMIFLKICTTEHYSKNKVRTIRLVSTRVENCSGGLFWSCRERSFTTPSSGGEKTQGPKFPPNRKKIIYRKL